MSLDKSQKKFIKENVFKISLSRISQETGLSQEDILSYLKNRWDEGKYNRFLEKNNQLEEDKGNIITKNFDFKKWFIKNLPFFILSAVLIFVTYFNSLNNQFVSDDKAIVNDGVGLVFPSLKESFKAGGGFISCAIYFIARQIGGLTPIYYRIFNIFFHLGCVWGVYILLNLISTPVIAVFSSLLFAVHPILIESVAWIAGGVYTEFSFFLIFSLIFYILSEKKIKYYFLSLLFFILSLLTSGKAVFFPLVIFFYDLAFNKKINIKKLLPFVLISFLESLILLGLIKVRDSDLQKLNYAKPQAINPLILYPVAITSYLELIFWPDKLTLYHSETYYTTGNFYLRAISFTMFLGIITYSFWKNKLVFFGLSLFFVSLLPNLLPSGLAWIVAERYVYFGSLGVIMAFSAVLGGLLKNKKWSGVVYIIFAVIIIALTVRTIVRNNDWKNEDNLWIATGKTSPSDPKTHNNLGDYYGRHGDMENAIREFKIALRLNPRYAEVYHNLAMAYQQTGRNEEAKQNYIKSLELNPNIWQSYEKIAVVFFSEGDYISAEKNMLKAHAMVPKNDQIAFNLGIIYTKLNNIAEAKKYFKKVLEINPNHAQTKQILSELK